MLKEDLLRCIDFNGECMSCIYHHNHQGAEESRKPSSEPNEDAPWIVMLIVVVMLFPIIFIEGLASKTREVLKKRKL